MQFCRPRRTVSQCVCGPANRENVSKQCDTCPVELQTGYQLFRSHIAVCSAVLAYDEALKTWNCSASIYRRDVNLAYPSQV